MTRAVALVGLLLLAGCARNAAPKPTTADATRAQAQWPSITLDDLQRGRTAFLGHCGNCHLPPRPTDHPPSEWPGHVADMSERAGLSAEDRTLVERYLITMAATPDTAPAR